jgi:DNA polymerase-3 subunit gamma/tau
MTVPEPLPTPTEMVLTEGDAIGAKRIRESQPTEASLDAATEERTQTEKPTPAAVLQPSTSQAEALQQAAIDALVAAKNQDTAADALADAVWVVFENEVRVQTELSKTMLPMVINTEAEKLVKAALRDAGAGALKLVLLPGAKTETVKKPRSAKSGSAQAKAMEHPIVQRAQTLFNAEVRTVIDLRDNDEL